MTLEIIGHSFAYEMECVLRLFYPGEKIAVTGEPQVGEDTVTTRINREGERLVLSAAVHLGDFQKSAESTHRQSVSEKEQERGLALLLFSLLCEKTGSRPAWGILTGVRPVRLCHSMMESGHAEEAVKEILTGDYLVTPEKADLALATGRVEREILAKNSPEAFSLYISIPFCPTRCLYCSFVSHEIQKAMKLLPDYVRLLREEIRATGEIARRYGLRLQTVYIGGGTPTTLSPQDLAAIMEAVEESFDLSHLLEYTVEAGRPDTITAEKLRVLKDHGADRISINPQTMNDEILAAIGRKHTAAETLDSFALARQAGFACINMDLIAGLPGETPQSFSRTLDQVLALDPENITLHTLTVKRSSDLRGQDGAFQPEPLDIGGLLDSAQSRFLEAGYRPYYLYRQKGTRQNLENTGFAKPGFEGIYNVYIMEEVHTVLAVGAGAVTKLYAPPNTLQRVYNYKFPYEYIGRFEEMLRRKSSVGEFYERY